MFNRFSMNFFKKELKNDKYFYFANKNFDNSITKNHISFYAKS